MEEIMEMILFDILRVQPSQVTGVFLTDLVNLILLPSLFILLFTKKVADGITHEPQSSTLNFKSYSGVMAVALYLVIITQGWYGSIAMFVSNYIIILLAVAAVLFFWTRFRHGGFGI
ncbi:MAG: hypothetical protein B6U68_02065 [Candidatus Aenigmarchaeota archaeon ex4484_14]|nr:MAG: hypothetical protein B6U68_02065 [Candidatus Aenigmarchaeota archaeon ex4484_14]